MSLIARATPASSGGPRNARLPVCGSAVPIFSVKSPPAEPPSVAAQPERTRAAAASVATAAAVFLLRRENENELILLLN